jgi:hypothetical protein
MTELLMSGHDRTYLPPRSLRGQIGTSPTAWDLLEQDSEWAHTTLDSVLASINAEADDALECTDCDDTGFYGLLAAGNDDLLDGLLRRVGEGTYESLSASGVWEEWIPQNRPIELLSLELAEDVAAAITSGAGGLLRKYCWPLAFLPPAAALLASPMPNIRAICAAGDFFAVVDDDDPGAVMSLVRVDEDSLTAFGHDGWNTWDANPDVEYMAIPLDASALDSIQKQMAVELTASGFGKPGKCKYCTNPATKDIQHSEGMAYIPVCDEHLGKGKQDAAACVPSGDPDPSNIVGIKDKPLAAAAALLADAPLTVSPNPKAEKLRRYWSTGKGAAKIRWNTPGDWKRCYRHLQKYMGLRAKGYCQNLHKRNTAVWTGSRLNVGGNGRGGLLSSSSVEEDLVAALQSGQWTGEPERNSDMAETAIKDGIYSEVDNNAGLLATLTAGGFPVAPPDEWYDNPKFTGPTPMEVGDDGRVAGHIATFDVTHIGMAGAVHAPRNSSGYRFFLTGALKTASGKQVNVGQLTLAGGHAPLHASAPDAVKHYDDTNSAVADVTVGEDEYGIWAAGSLRPNVTPEQVRVFRASPLSGDWRPINGNLELVAACAVNVPGFPTARAIYAGGAIVALVAAGARPLAERRLAMTADAMLLERIDKIEAQVFPKKVFIGENEVTSTAPVAASTIAVTEQAPTPAPEATAEVVAEAEAVVEAAAADPVEATKAADVQEADEVQPEVADKLDPDQLAQVRKDAAELKRELLRREVHGVTAGTMPPQFAKNAAKKSTKQIPETERKGGGYPIKDATSLKNAIQAVGRAAPGDRAKTIAHIKAAAAKLGLTKMLPKTPGW